VRLLLGRHLQPVRVGAVESALPPVAPSKHERPSLAVARLSGLPARKPDTVPGW
jgi:hypothetical protein